MRQSLRAGLGPGRRWPGGVCRGRLRMSTEREIYLDDGLYASFGAWQVKLRAPRDNGDHEVFLEQSTLQAFLEFLDALPI
jgi:hypothetical protein